MQRDELEPGTPVWWYDSRYLSGYAAAPVIAVFIAMRGSRAGIAVLMRNGTWRPKLVSLSSLVKRHEQVELHKNERTSSRYVRAR